LRAITTPPRRGRFWGVVLGRHRQMVIDDVLGILDEAIQPRPVPLKQNGGERERRTRRKDQDFRTGSMRLHRQPVATIFDDLGVCPKSNFVRIARMVKSRGNLSQADAWVPRPPCAARPARAQPSPSPCATSWIERCLASTRAPARWRPGRHSRRAVCPHARESESDGVSSRARRWDKVWPPAHRRDLQRRSLPRIDPAGRCAPTWPLERIRRATAVCYLQRDVFIERSGLDWIPAIVAGWPHCTFSSFKAIAPVQYLPRCTSIQDRRRLPARFSVSHPRAMMD
jgi:hypothetical protein